jgi:hypothetical protein
MNFSRTKEYFSESRLKITPGYAVAYQQKVSPYYFPGSVIAAPQVKYVQGDLFPEEVRNLPDYSEEQIVRNSNSLANLSKAKHTGIVSKKAVKRLYTAMDWLLLIARNKWAENSHNHRLFKYKLGLLTLTLPCEQIMHKYDPRPSIKRFHTVPETGERVPIPNPLTPKQQSDLFLKHFALNNFFTQLRTKYELQNYIWKAEPQENGNIHFHIVVDKYFDHAAIRPLWNSILDNYGYIEKYRTNQMEFHKNGFRPRPELFKKWSLRKQIDAYKSGRINNWNNPNSTDGPHSLKKIRNAKAYLAKYLTKSPDVSRAVKQAVHEAYVANNNQSLGYDTIKLITDTVRSSLRIAGNLWYISQSLSKLKQVQCNNDVEITAELEQLIEKFPDKVIQKEWCTVFAFDIYELIKAGCTAMCNRVRDYIIELRNKFYPPGSGRYSDLGVPLLIFDVIK